jgi:outer membrane biosynthesis protein TonB
MTPEEEKKNRRVGMMVSLGIHSLVVLLFAFLMAWREPNPPLPEYGIELNFGLDDAGTGEVQPLTPVVDSENEEEAAPEEESSEEQLEEEVLDESPEEVTEDVIDQPEVYEDIESADVVEEQEQVAEETQEVIKETEEPVTESIEPKEDKPENETETEGAEGVKGEADQAETVNQGDKTDETGDQGNDEGQLDERALYGKPGGGGGSSLKMAGWIWDFKPKPKDTSDESGRIVFEIKIDDQGEIISIRTLERTVSPSVEAIYKAEVEKLTFSKTDNAPPAPQSVGQITFIIKSN